MFVTIDKDAGVCNLFESKPVRNKNRWESPRRNCDNFQVGYLGCLPKHMFPDLKWEDEPIEVNIFTNEFMQGFGDACYERGEQDACRFEYGENPEGNLTIKEYVDSKNKTL